MAPATKPTPITRSNGIEAGMAIAFGLGTFALIGAVVALLLYIGHHCRVRKEKRKERREAEAKRKEWIQMRDRAGRVNFEARMGTRRALDSRYPMPFGGRMV